MTQQIHTTEQITELKLRNTEYMNYTPPHEEIKYHEVLIKFLTQMGTNINRIAPRDQKKKVMDFKKNEIEKLKKDLKKYNDSNPLEKEECIKFIQDIENKAKTQFPTYTRNDQMNKTLQDAKLD